MDKSLETGMPVKVNDILSSFNISKDQLS
jgi:hypothetical protein